MIARVAGAVLLGAVWSAGAAQAGTITYYYGDDDCFGSERTVCPDATIPPEFSDNFYALYGPVFAEPYYPSTGVGDPFGQENYNSATLIAGGSLTWTHTITLAGLNVTGAEIRMRTGGLADLKGPYSITVNGTAVGEVQMVTGSFEELYKMKLFAFPFDPALLVEGLNTVSLTRPQDGRGFDNFSWDFSSLTLFTRDAAPAITEPAPLALAASGLALLAALRRRRASAS